MRLQLAMLYVKDLERMAAFYGDVLGLTPVAGALTESWAEFEAGAVRLGLHAIPEEFATDIVISLPPVVREETPYKLLFGVADVEGEAARLEAAGVTVMRRPWGSCDAVDPEGNVFGFCAEV